MVDPFDAVGFLSRSENRVTVLDRLAGHPMSQGDLADEIDVDRTTLWRVVTDLESRGWLTTEEGLLTLTPVGLLVSEVLGDAFDSIAVAERLGNIVQWLPLEELGFDVSRLVDAEVAVPTTNNPLAPMRLADRISAEAGTAKILSHALAHGVVEAHYEGVLAGRQTVEMVVPDSVIEAIVENDTTLAQFSELLESDRFATYRYPETVPYILSVVDEERVGLGVDDDQGRPQAVFDIRDPVVARWATGMFEAYRRESTRLGPAEFTP